MKIAPRDIARLLAQPAPQYLCFLFHGADSGLIRERGKAIASQFVENLDDPFQSVSLSGADVAADPVRLADELGAYPVFGGERVVRLQGNGSEMLPAVKNALDTIPAGARLIIEANETTTRHALVKLCEAAPHVASIGCYSDDDRDISQMARDMLEKDNIKIDQDALTLLVSRLGSDRIASRTEIEKCALYAGPSGHLTANDIEELIGDSSAQAIDSFVKSVLSGDVGQLTKLLEKARQEDIAPIAILRQFIMIFRQLFEATGHIKGGNAAAQAISMLRPPVHFKMKAVMTSAATRMSNDLALSFWQKLIETEAELKSGQIADAHSHIGQTLLGFTLRLKARR